MEYKGPEGAVNFKYTLSIIKNKITKLCHIFLILINDLHFNGWADENIFDFFSSHFLNPCRIQMIVSKTK